jgi:hypothetical protein
MLRDEQVAVRLLGDSSPVVKTDLDPAVALLRGTLAKEGDGTVIRNGA